MTYDSTCPLFPMILNVSVVEEDCMLCMVPKAHLSLRDPSIPADPRGCLKQEGCGVENGIPQ